MVRKTKATASESASASTSVLVTIQIATVALGNGKGRGWSEKEESAARAGVGPEAGAGTEKPVEAAQSTQTGVEAVKIAAELEANGNCWEHKLERLQNWKFEEILQKKKLAVCPN